MRNLGLGLSVAIVVGAIWTAPTLAKNVLTVCPSGPPTCEYATIQDALNAAVDGDSIVVAAGTYSGGFTISKRIKLLGSSASQTTITGGDPAAVTISSGTTVDIRGFTVSGAANTGVVNEGALTLRQSAVTANNPIEGTHSEVAGILNDGTLSLLGSTVNGNGGALDVLTGGLLNRGTLTLTRSSVSGNFAGRLGGLDNRGTAVLRHCALSNNSAFNAIGGIENSGQLDIRACAVEGNSADNRGGIANSGSLTVRQSMLTGNHAIFGASALWNNGGDVLLGSSVISNNYGYFYGAISNGSGGRLTIANGTVAGNTADGGQGGGVFNDSGSVTLRHSNVTANTAAVGGGVFNEGGNVTLKYSVVTQNTALGYNGLFGGGIFNSLGTIVLEHSAVFGNVPDDCFGC
jgi:hypothetical protein